MGTYTDITIEGTTIYQPHEFIIERYNITKSGRVASGLMTMELIAKKRKFLFRYRTISSTSMNTILDLIDDEDAIFFDIAYKENNVQKTATVYAGHIPSTLIRSGSLWYWKNVNFDLIER
jgi:hypothetical protein